jgi:hypothetical protein
MGVFMMIDDIELPKKVKIKKKKEETKCYEIVGTVDARKEMKNRLRKRNLKRKMR